MTAMMHQTGSWHCFTFLFMLCTLPLNPILAYFLKDCTIRYSDNVTAGVSVDCGACDLVSIPDDIPKDIISLTLQKNDIQMIKRADLYNLSNLRDLDISFNSITHVDDGAFVKLMELKVLHVNSNKLTTLTDNMFQGLFNLLILRLDWNTIKSINPAAFLSLPNLQAINLESNYIHQITDIITILQLPRLHVLNISIDELVSFQSKDLPLNMSFELRELRVDSGSIQKFSITTAVFPHLETVDLSHCCNSSGWEWDIPEKYFLRNITKVYFNDSYISFNTIIKSLQSLDSLEYLQLYFIGKWINRGLLNVACKIPTLRTLNLQYNTIANLSEKLSPCTQLTNLDLSYNDLEELSKDSIKHIKQLSHLNLASNHFSKVPDDVKNLSMLQVLNMRYNQLNDLSCLDFINLTRLTHLHLDNNHISELKQCVFQHLNELKVLTLNDNGMSESGGAITGLQKLEYLDLTGNRIWFNFFNSPKSLRQLYVETDLNYRGDTLFEGLDKLETLLIYGCDPPSLPSLKSLKNFTIQLSLFGFVNISYITFKTIPNLEVLDLSKCGVKSLDFLAQANLPRVSWLDLSQNELTVIDVSVFRFLPALRYVNMTDNPFVCDCSNSDFQKWMLNNNQTQVVGAHSYTCGYPLAKKGTRFLDIDYHSCWMDASFICYISSTCAIVLTLLTSFTYHFLRLHLLYAYYLFLAFLYDAKKRKWGSPQHYDAFISYNVHDELWVYREMLPMLEGEQGWRLCLHHRDFQPGKPIVENIAEAIYGSRKTICVISHHYLESEWCSREIQMASYRLFDEQKDVLILVFLEDIPAQQLSPYYHIRRLVKRQTYLSWSQAGQHPGLFWQNLRRALDTPDTDPCLNE